MENERDESLEFDKKAIAEEFLAEKDAEINEKKLINNAKGRVRVQKAIASMNYSTKRDKVAAILDMYPEARDNDVFCTLKYWEVFQSDIYSGNKPVPPTDLFKLERETTVVRIRAKIQNDYGLYLGTQETRRKRRQREVEIKEEFISDSKTPSNITVFADETGKNEKYLIVGSVWFLDMRKSASFESEVIKFKTENDFYNKNKGIVHEFHFSNMQKNQLGLYKKFIDFVASKKEFISFKIIKTPNSNNRRSIEDTVVKLYENLIIKGFQSELETGRVILPRRLLLTVDISDGLNGLTKEGVINNVNNTFNTRFTERAQLKDIVQVESHGSSAVQLADLIAGAVNRKVNLDNKGYKTELADYIFEKLRLDEENDSYELIDIV